MPDNFYNLFQIIYIARNPKDVAVSLYYFTLSFKPITRYDGKFEDFCDLFIEDKGKVSFTGDKNITILHLYCRTSDLQFSLVLQNACTCPLKVYAIKNITE